MWLYFCSQPETVDHLLFQCSTAKVVWATVAVCFGANNVPRSLNQCWEWYERWLPLGKKFHTLGIAAVCWAGLYICRDGQRGSGGRYKHYATNCNKLAEQEAAEG